MWRGRLACENKPFSGRQETRHTKNTSAPLDNPANPVFLSKNAELFEG